MYIFGEKLILVCPLYFRSQRLSLVLIPHPLLFMQLGARVPNCLETDLQAHVEWLNIGLGPTDSDIH